MSATLDVGEYEDASYFVLNRRYHKFDLPVPTIKILPKLLWLVFIKNKLKDSSVSKIQIERVNGANDNAKVKITIHTAKPGNVIGRRGEAIQALSNELQKMTSQKVLINIEEIKKPELDSQLVAEDI